MAYRELTGNLFASKADALVNTVNCVGPMGKGVALEFRRRFPQMFEEYAEVCRRGTLRPGQILPYRKSRPWILNFAVKDDWKHPSRIEWIESCLEKFCHWYPGAGLKSVAFPWMGAMNGRIPLARIQEVTRRYLSNLKDIEVEVYSFDPDASDPLFERLGQARQMMTQEQIARTAKLQRHQAELLYQLLGSQRVASLARIEESGVLGKKGMDNLYLFLNAQHEYPVTGRIESPPQARQLDLFDNNREPL